MPSESPPTRSRCYDCFRPKALCFCDKIPSIDNRTEIIVLQHMRERFHPFNTARIVRKALNNATLLVDHNKTLAGRLGEISLTRSAGVLYPGPGGRLLDEIPADERPSQLIVIDGTWHHAKTLLRDIPQLNELKRYRIQPSEPGRYRIRREPNETALSTLEATVAALRALEPETAGLDELTMAFDTMIQSQLDHPVARTSWRKNLNRHHNTMGIPRAILPPSKDDEHANLENVVVVYGESQPGQVGCKRAPRGKDKRQPIFWVAERIATGESLRIPIRSPVELTEDFLEHLGLRPHQWQDALSIAEFKQAWADFVCPDDTIVAHHASTLRLLHNTGATVPNQVILKAIKFDPDGEHATLESFLESELVDFVAPQLSARADRRLANAISLTRYLNQFRST